MTLQEQLAQPQKPTEFRYLPVFEGGFGASLLGNQPGQTPARMSDKGPISETGLFVGNYDRLIQNAVKAAAASGVLLKAEVASVGNIGGVIVNQLISGFGTFNGLILNAATPTTVASRPRVANTESTEMSWLVQNAQELGRHKGEWLLIRGQQLLVHSPDFADVRAAVREQRIDSPFVYYVPTDEESNTVTI
jgi:hypothetical protein